MSGPFRTPRMSKDLIVVGEGGYKTLQAAIDSIRLSDTYTSVAGSGQISLWNNNDLSITGNASSFLKECLGPDIYIQASGDTKAYKVLRSETDTDLVMTIPRLEADVPAPVNFSIIQPTPKKIVVLDRLAEDITINGALGFIDIEFLNTNEIHIAPYLESGRLRIFGLKAHQRIPQTTIIPGVLGAQAPDQPVGAIVDVECYDFNIENSVVISPRDFMYMIRCGNIVIANSHFKKATGDGIRMASLGSVVIQNTMLESGESSDSATALVLTDTNLSGDYTVANPNNTYIHKNNYLAIASNHSGTCFHKLSGTLDLRCYNTTFHLKPGPATINALFLFITSLATSINMEFVNCSYIEDAASAPVNFITLPFLPPTGTNTINILFRNSDLFSGNINVSGGTWTVNITHEGIKEKSESIGAANKTAVWNNVGTVFDFDTSTADRTLMLPPASHCIGGWIEARKSSSDANQLIISADGSETINGVATANTTSAYGRIRVESDGTEWFVVNKI